MGYISPSGPPWPVLEQTLPLPPRPLAVILHHIITLARQDTVPSCCIAGRGEQKTEEQNSMQNHDTTSSRISPLSVVSEKFSANSFR